MPRATISPLLVLASTPALALAVLAACSPGAPELDPECEAAGAALDAAIPLIDAAAWRQAPVERDPLAAHRAGTVACPSSAWGKEFGVLEISTEACNYASVEQPLLDDIAVGDRLGVELWWAALLASEATRAHLALLVDGRLVWETQVEIPGPADARALEVISPIAAEAGATLTFHLHNHGPNSWTLASFERVELACSGE